MKQHNRSNSKNGGFVNSLANEELQAHFKDRVLYLIFNSIGSNVSILTNTGVNINGILQNIDPSNLKLIIKQKDGVVLGYNYEDCLEFEIQDVDLFNNKNYTLPKGNFKTDKDIGMNNNNQQRSEMEKWVPEQLDSNIIGGLSLEDDVDEDGTHKNWDQFQTNEEKFGIKSEFDEHLYTTKINKNNPNYAKNLAKATKLAKEIENQGHMGNAHLAEERGLKFDDSGFDEEDKYSGVSAATTAATTITNEKEKEKAVDAKSDALFQSLINKDSKNFQFGGDKESTKYIPPNQRSRIQNIDPSIVSANNNSTAPTTTATATSIPAKPPVKQKTTTMDNLKKINTQNEINALKEFSQTFKIPSKFPKDLLPILSKDKLKQEEILKKLSPEVKQVKPVEKEKTEEKKEEKKEDKPPGKKIGDPAKTTTFKLNPKAAAFTPSSSSTTPVSTPSFSKNSPRLANNNYQRKRYQGVFFSTSKITSVENRKDRDFNQEFNFFKGCIDEFNKKQKDSPSSSSSQFYLEKPFNTPPTWTKDDIEKPYKSFFPDIDPQQQHPHPQQQQHPQQRFRTFHPQPSFQPMLQQQPYFYPPQPFIQPQYLQQLSPTHNPTQLNTSPSLQHPAMGYPPYQNRPGATGPPPNQGYYPQVTTPMMQFGSPIMQQPPMSNGRNYKNH